MRVHAPAKINLSLRIVGRRPDGYHELRTIFQSIALHDTLTIRRRRGPFALTCDDAACPADNTNLVWRAAARVWAASGRRGGPRDVEIALTKRIPMQAGLGGGSSDAAAALRALASLWRVSDSRWRDIAMSLGSDVPYFLEGGTVLGLGCGEVLFPLAAQPAAWVAVAVPRFGVRTPDAYAWWDKARAAGRPRRGLANDLQAPVAARHAAISRFVNAMRRAGALHAAMSGSGSAVFGLFAHRASAVRAARALERGEPMVSRICVTHTINRAAYQRLAGIAAYRINLPFALRSLGHS
jgi:4-diphosphocytidyl-2-C-methyl-D-erythritol kinase